MSFDILAPHYRWMERVLAGGKLQRCRTAFLDRIPAPNRALLVGEGNGRFLQEFAKRFPRAQVTCMDGSAKMLERARANVAAMNNIQFIHSDIFAWNAGADCFDLIVTNFFLDCFQPNQLSEVIEKLSAAASPNVTWLLADFCEPRAGWRKWRARSILASMYLFFRFATKLPAKELTSPDACLASHGFTLVARRDYDWGLLHSDYWRKNQLEKAF